VGAATGAALVLQSNDTAGCQDAKGRAGSGQGLAVDTLLHGAGALDVRAGSNPP